MKIKANRLIDAMKAIQSLDAMPKPLEIDGSVRITLYRNGSRIRTEGEIYEKAKADIRKEYRSRRIKILEDAKQPEGSKLSQDQELQLLKSDEWYSAELESINDEVDLVIKTIKMSQLKVNKNNIPITALIALDFMITDDEEGKVDQPPGDE